MRERKGGSRVIYKVTEYKKKGGLSLIDGFCVEIALTENGSNRVREQ